MEVAKYRQKPYMCTGTLNEQSKISMQHEKRKAESNKKSHVYSITKNSRRRSVADACFPSKAKIIRFSCCNYVWR